VISLSAATDQVVVDAAGGGGDEVVLFLELLPARVCLDNHLPVSRCGEPSGLRSSDTPGRMLSDGPDALVRPAYRRLRPPGNR
jgi:hypothetical protein